MSEQKRNPAPPGPDRAAGAAGQRAEMETLLAAALATAAEVLERADELSPFALRWVDGTPGPEVVPPVAGEDPPSSESLVAELCEALRMEVGAGVLLAAAIVADVVVQLPGEGPVDAVRVNVEHSEAPPLCAYLTYARREGRVVFADMVRTPGDVMVFGPPPAARSG